MKRLMKRDETANETADGTKDRDLISLNMAAPVRNVPDMLDNPKTIYRSGVVYIYNSWRSQQRKKNYVSITYTIFISGRKIPKCKGRAYAARKSQ